MALRSKMGVGKEKRKHTFFPFFFITLSSLSGDLKQQTTLILSLPSSLPSQDLLPDRRPDKISRDLRVSVGLHRHDRRVRDAQVAHVEDPAVVVDDGV